MHARAKIKVCGYIRESTSQQGFHGYRPDVQKKSIEEYCKRHDFELVKMFSDWGSGSGTDKRENFIKMIEFVKKRKDISFIVLKEIDRFYRNIRKALNDEYELESGYNIFVVDTITDYEPRKYLTEGVGDVWDRRLDARKNAESELRTIKRRVKEGYTSKAARGQYVGPLCFGLKWLEENNEQVGWDKSKVAVVQEIFKLYSTGRKGFTSLARFLNDKGYSRTIVKKIKVKRADGSDTDKKICQSSPFTRDIVRSMLINKTYIGRQNTNKHLKLRSLDEAGKEAYLIPLIDEDLFNKAQQQIAKNRRGKPAYKGKGNSRQKRIYLFQGMIKNNDCGCSLYCAAETLSNGTEVRRYICKGRKKGTCNSPSVRANDVEAQIIDFLGQIKIKNINQIEKELRDIIKISAKALTDAKITKRYDAKHRKQLKVLEEMLADDYSWETEVMIKDLKSVIEEREKEKNKPTSYLIKYYDFLELRNVLKDISSAFEGLQSLIAQKDLIQILFKQVFITRTTKEEDTFVWKSLLMNLNKEVENKKEVKEDTNVKMVSELLALLKRFIPLLFEEIQVTRGKGGDNPKIIFKPTGLFLLLHDDTKHGTTSMACKDGLYRKSLESFPAHHENSSLIL